MTFLFLYCILVFVREKKERDINEFSLEDMPDEIFFDLEKDEKVLKLIPIIKDIDNPENISNKFKLGIVTSFFKTTKEVSKE